MISLVTPFAYQVLLVGLAGSVLIGVVVGVWKACSSQQKQDKQ
jgi:hypothetical protein